MNIKDSYLHGGTHVMKNIKFSIAASGTNQNKLVATITWAEEGSSDTELAIPINGATFGSLTKNTVFAAPNGSAGVPSFRALVADDIPNLGAGKITSGEFAAARLPLATNSAKGAVMLGVAKTSDADSAITDKKYWVKMNANGKLFVDIPWTDHTYTVNNATFSIKSKIGTNDAVTLSDFTANQSAADDFTLIQGSNITFTNDATNRTLTIAGTPNTTYKLTLNGIVKGTTGGTDLGTFYAIATSDTSTANQVWMRNSSNNGYGWRTLGSRAFDSTAYLPLSGGTLTGKVTVNSSHRNAGMYGVYDSHYLGHIWSMGTSYTISADGKDPASLYGLAYFHTNWSNDTTYNTNASNKTAIGTYAGEHQVGWFKNGVIQASIGDYVWSRGGFIKNGSSNNYVLLGGGGHKAVSDFASATKLENTRKLWGNDFDGTANVGDTIILNAGDSGRQVRITKDGLFLFRAATSGWAGGLWASSNDGSTTLGAFGYSGSGDTLTYLFIGNSHTSPWVTFLPNGNVGIGTTNPSVKFEVNGSANIATLYENSHRVITTANIGSQSVNYANSAGSASSASYLSTYAADGDNNLKCLQNIFNSLPKSVATAVRLQHGNHSMAIGWFLSGYGYSNAYGGWFISDYGTPSWVGVDNGNWNTCNFITSNNIGSQSVSYASSAGNSDTCDGLHVHSGRNNEANKIVRTDGYGYMQCGWINTTSGGFNGAITGINKIYCSEDDYIRYLSPSNFISALSLLTTAGGTITRSANSASTSSWALKIVQGTDNGAGQYDSLVISANDVPAIRISDANGTQLGLCGGDYHGTISSTHDLRFFVNGTANSSCYGGMSGTQKLTINSTGVGVGREPSSYAFEVQGDIKAYNSWLRTSGDAGWCSDTYSGGWYMCDANWIRNYNSKALLIAVDANTWGGGGHNLASDFYQSNHVCIGLRNSVCGWYLCSNSNRNFYLSYRPSGNASGYSSDTYALHIEPSGNVYATNYYTTSDRSKKQNISLFSEHIYKFQLKGTEKWHYGVIAQEVPEMFRDGEEGNMTVNYNSVLSYYIGILENRVKELEDKIKSLETNNKLG